MTVANLAGNRPRNRYSDIVPYDANRVKLFSPLKLPNESSFASDYVNASYLGATLAAAAAAATSAAASSGCGGRRESILNNPALSLASMDPGFIAAQVQIKVMQTAPGLSIFCKHRIGLYMVEVCL